MMTSLLKDEHSNFRVLSNEELGQTEGGIGPFAIYSAAVIAAAGVFGVGYAAGRWVGDKIFN